MYDVVEHEQHQKRDEMMVSIVGRLKPIQQAIVALLRRLESYYGHQRDMDIYVKIVMSSSYASKLIGASMVQINDDQRVA